MKKKVNDSNSFPWLYMSWLTLTSVVFSEFEVTELAFSLYGTTGETVFTQI
jgi:hypothetical protein